MGEITWLKQKEEIKVGKKSRKDAVMKECMCLEQAEGCVWERSRTSETGSPLLLGGEGLTTLELQRAMWICKVGQTGMGRTLEFPGHHRIGRCLKGLEGLVVHAV